MKKLTSLFTAAALMLSASAAVAADKEAREPDVFVNETLVEFADQNAYITDEGRTLVPARGVFEAMDCKVDWDAENYVVTVTNEAQKKEITLTIDNTEMKVVTDGKETVKTLDVPATLMNNRTMVPLRAISESLGCMVVWNEAEYSVGISYTKQITAEEFSQILQNIFNGSGDKEDTKVTPSLRITSDAKNIEVGQEFEVYVNVENLEPEYKISTFAVAFEFDRSIIEYVPESASFINVAGEKEQASLFVENTEFENGAKASLVTLNAIEVNQANPRVFVCRFKLLKPETAEISLDDTVFDDGRYATQFSVTKDGETMIPYKGKIVSIDTTPFILTPKM